jgi:hypothetical protein
MERLGRCRRRMGSTRSRTCLLLVLGAAWAAAFLGPALEGTPSGAAAAHPAGKRLVLPSGRDRPVPLGAYSTRLDYLPEWDRLWPVSEVSDVVVSFGEAETRFVFWRGTSYIPCWTSRRGPWFTNEFFERHGGHASGTTSMVEPMSDKQCRYSSVRIVENSDARVVIHWRYAPVDLNFTVAYVDPKTRWGDWADEYYYLYPDAVGVRKATLYTSALHDWMEYQESIVVNQPGSAPEDSVHFDALSLANLKGEQKTYTWTEKGAPELTPVPDTACIQMINLKSLWKPFSIVNPDGAAFESYRGHAPGSRFNFWDHWPVSQDKSDTRIADSPNRPSHTSLSHIRWKPYAEDGRSQTWIMMHGMSRSEAVQLVPLAASWIHPPELKVLGGPFSSVGYDPAQRAYILNRRGSEMGSRLQVQLAGTVESPVVNPALVVRNWGTANAKLTLDARPVRQGPDFRVGHVSTLEGIDLILWFRAQTAHPIRISISPR